MIDPLAFNELLNRIETNRVDPAIYQRSRDALSEMLRHEYWQALQHAQEAVILATRANDSTTTGITFLFRAIIAHSSDIKTDRDRAPMDSAAAIKWLKRDEHHCALAELIQARILLEQTQARAAIEHYRRGTRQLGTLAAACHRRDDRAREREYRMLEQAAQAMIDRIQIEVRPRENTLNTDTPIRYPEDQPKPLKLPLPIDLIWPLTSAPFGLKYNSIYVNAPIDSIELSRLTFNATTYFVQPIDFPGLQGLPQLRARQQYFALQLLTPNQASLPSPCYVLVRFQDRPDHRDQIIAVTDGRQGHAWLTISDETAEDTRLHIIGGARRRKWRIWGGEDLQNDAPEDGSLYCIGIAEALLSPIANPT